MIRIFPNEKFIEFPFPHKLKFKYAFSNYGRVVSFSTNIENGNLIKGQNVNGFAVFRYKIFADGKKSDKSIFIHKIVAELFVSKTSEDHNYVLHLDHDSLNNKPANLQWGTYEEKIAHYKKSPRVIEAKKKLLEHNLKSDGRKLTVTKVIHLKKLLADPNRKTRLKILAKQFGISEMQLYRIKSGENWGHVG